MNSDDLTTNCPEDVDDLLNAGLQAGRNRDPQTASGLFMQVLELEPDNAQALHNLAVAQAEMSRNELAVDLLLRAISIAPQYAEAHYNLGTVLLKLGQRAEAIQEFYIALRLRPDYVEPMVNLSLSLSEIGRSGEALMIIEQALRVAPGSFEAQNNLGLILHDLGRYQDAVRVWGKLLDSDPRNVDAHVNYGNSLKELGRFSESIASYDWAIRFDPANVSAHWNRALACLQAGHYSDGWAGYEWRWKREGIRLSDPCTRRWMGEDLSDKTILVRTEQGFGDMIMFLRYCRELKCSGASVKLACPKRLCRLFSTCPWLDELIPEDSAIGQSVDFEIPMASLPLYFFRRSKFGACDNYLSPEKPLADHWRKKLRNGNELLVAVCWQGNPEHRLDHHRSIPVERLKPLSSIPNVRLISLQLTRSGNGSSPSFIEHQDELDIEAAFIDSAAIVQCVDLVVTCDSAIGHLSGALGQRTFLVLGKQADWRWGLKATTTPWYAKTHIFRGRRRYHDLYLAIEQMTAQKHGAGT